MVYLKNIIMRTHGLSTLNEQIYKYNFGCKKLIAHPKIMILCYKSHSKRFVTSFD